MELRKNISQGSFWFAITTLFVLGIVRCHRLAVMDEQLSNAAVSDSAMLSDTLLGKPHYDKFRKRRWKKWEHNRGGRDTLNVADAVSSYAGSKGKPLSPKLALELLLALRSSGGRGFTAGVLKGSGLKRAGWELVVPPLHECMCVMRFKKIF